MSSERLRPHWRALSRAGFVLLPLVWYTHVVLTKLGDPLGAAFDVGLWVTASALKLLVLAALFQMLQRVHAGLFDSRRRALRAFLIWVIASLAILGLLALLRSWWAPLVRSDAVKYYYAGDGLKLGGELRANRDAWLASWANGSVIASECALLIVLAAVQAGVAYRIGRRSLPSALTASFACGLLVFGYVVWCPWFRWDYDNFHGDVLAVAMFCDLLPLPLAGDPYTTLMVPLYLALGIAHWAILGSNEAAR